MGDRSNGKENGGREMILVDKNGVQIQNVESLNFNPRNIPFSVMVEIISNGATLDEKYKLNDIDVEGRVIQYGIMFHCIDFNLQMYQSKGIVDKDETLYLTAGEETFVVEFDNKEFRFKVKR